MQIKNILFLLPVATQPRYQKRITALMQEGISTNALYFNRDYFSGHTLPCGSECIGKISHGKYHQRIFTILKSLGKVRSKLSTAEVIYVFGMDMLFLAVLASTFKKRKIIYEVSDIRDALVKRSFFSFILRSIEKFLTRFVSVIVVTAPNFVTGYYKKFHTSVCNNYFVLENKINLDESLVPYRPEQNRVNNLTIGYFGLLRCERSWQVLNLLSQKAKGSININVYGRVLAPSNLIESIQQNSAIFYGGEFIWPDDLAAMYGGVDLIWGCYPYGESSPGNWQWARTNRFYEACFFKRPIIALKDSADAEIVEKLGIGFAIDLSDVDKAVYTLLNLNMEDIAKWQENLQRIDKRIFLYSNEHKVLLDKLSEL